MMILCLSLFWYRIITWISLGFGLLIRQNEASEDVTLDIFSFSSHFIIEDISSPDFFFYSFKYIYWCLTKSISYWSTKCWLWHCHRTKTCNRPNNRLEDGVWLWWFAALTWAMQTFSGGRKLFWPWPWTFPQPNQVVLVQTQPRNEIVSLSQVRLVTSNQTTNTCL